jgi:DNA-binding response OmpR family regulator
MAATIAVIEDDADIRGLLERTLRNAGYETTFARDAVSALAVIRKSSPDLIVLDIGLPGGDGFVVLERLSQFDALAMIPVVVITARTQEATRRRAEDAGVAASIQKPFSAATLLDTVSSVLATRGR